MIYLLPPSKTGYIFFQLFHRVKSLLRPKRAKYTLAAVIDIFLIVLILIFGRQPAQKVISPLVSSFQSFSNFVSHKTTAETFAFVPDLAPNKFPYIDLEGLTTLSFFDVPLTAEGGLNYDSRGYQSFTSYEALDLFDRARYQNTKVFLTLSALSDEVINNILDNPSRQYRLADEAVQEITNSNLDGITIDFEYPQEEGKGYQKQFTSFVSFLTNKIHQAVPRAQVAVAVPTSKSYNQSLYNMEELSKVSDKVFLIASDMIVPEVKNNSSINPVFGFNGHEYWSVVSSLLNHLFTKVSQDRLVMERAWYGNGGKYPLYIPNHEPEPENYKQPSNISLGPDTIERLVIGVPEKGKTAARQSIPLIAKALNEEGILDSNVLAYALATVEHETDETFAPIEEIGGRINARRLGYEGGSNYFGRGYIQITHLRNYQKFGQRIGLGDKLAKHPELASNPEIAAKILAAFFKDNNVANLASSGNFVAARRPINPDYNGYSVAYLASKYEVY